MPPVTRTLLLANVAVFVLQWSAGEELREWLFSSFALWPPGGRGWPPFQPWQLVSYSFLHGGMAHLFFNMFALYMFGSAIEQLFGRRDFLLYYLVCVVSAALVHLVMTAGLGFPVRPTVGASGGVLGVLLAYGLYYPRRRLLLLFPPIPIQARYLVILCGVVSLVLGVTGTASGIAHFAHLGGMLGGFLMIMQRGGAGGRPTR